MSRRTGITNGRLLAACGVLAAISVIVLAVLAHQVPYFPIDLAVTREVQTIHTAWIVTPLAVLSFLGFPPLVDFIAGAFVFALLCFGRRWAAISALFAACGIAGLNFLFKALVDRPRPPSSLVHVAHHIPNGSFPAGHVMTFTAFFGFLCYYAWAELKPSWWRTSLIVVFLVSIVLMGPARVASGEHWPSDVLGGYLLGIFWLVITIRFHVWGINRMAARSMVRVTTMVATLLLLSAPPARAYRPFAGTDAGVAALHRLEVEFGPLGYTRTGDERALISPELSLTYGAGSSYEFGAEARRMMVMSPEPEGVAPKINDVVLTAAKLLKHGSNQDKKGLSVLAEGELLFPPNNQQSLGVGLLLVASQTWEDVALHLNGEVSRTSEREGGRFASLIAEGPDRWEVRPVAEAAIEQDGEETALKTLLLGFIWQTRTSLAMDFAYRMGYADEHLSEFRSGITWNRHLSGPRMP